MLTNSSPRMRASALHHGVISHSWLRKTITSILSMGFWEAQFRLTTIFVYTSVFSPLGTRVATLSWQPLGALEVGARCFSPLSQQSCIIFIFLWCSSNTSKQYEKPSQFWENLTLMHSITSSYKARTFSYTVSSTAAEEARAGGLQQ